ncbi:MULTISPECIES: zinc ABC transporter substrate-binding protein [Rhizobiaceae]|uniref:High-affinity zinc uptake system protein ZnuA n=1 Tax=Aliirhizobium cellulosilyticum TaxID=393664 RepID=A0A7W6X9I0_9HYPH|nr:zinc ABC transporter substrate-binding protein [Rhizobium cellulosilyticum]MBB4347793.1 zinc transport system substrate-binding protein [Rhizobium cellulosilyticum]MBB4409813.1 zinc transport system substrate-binding protein [Rhizobium cellulosilyticum]MBB4444500.1 zinc transport system substrate-binding protein [Rhizobium cellulosilyticum]
MKFAAALLLSSAAMISAPGAFAATPDVVVSIKPIHSLVASVMKGVAEPKLIVEGAASPHTYNMRPSNAAALQNADLIFWVGHGMEAFLEKPLEALGSKASVVTLEDAPGLTKLKFREGGVFEPEAEEEGHDHGHSHGAAQEHADGEDDGDHDHEGNDVHLWLDPMNAKAMAAEIEKQLVQADAEHAATYQKNAAELMGKLDTLDAELKAELSPIKDKPFIVFHDAYQYFEHRYGVKVAGSITVSPETMPGAERVKEIHQKVEDLGATCVFAEPQFEPKLVKVVTEGSKAKSGVLDPEAGALKEGPELYFDMMRGLATSLKTCLSQ